MPTTNRTSAASRVTTPSTRPAADKTLKVGAFSTTAPGVTVKSAPASRGANSPVNVTISRSVRPFSESGTLNVTINGKAVKVPVKGNDRPDAIAKKLEKALEKAAPGVEVRIKENESWGRNGPVGSSKAELVIALKEHFKPGGPLGPTINIPPRPPVAVNPAPPPPVRPEPTVNPAPVRPPPVRPQPTVNPAPVRPQPTVNPAPPGRRGGDIT